MNDLVKTPDFPPFSRTDLACCSTFPMELLTGLYAELKLVSVFVCLDVSCTSKNQWERLVRTLELKSASFQRNFVSIFYYTIDDALKILLHFVLLRSVLSPSLTPPCDLSAMLLARSTRKETPCSTTKKKSWSLFVL